MRIPPTGVQLVAGSEFLASDETRLVIGVTLPVDAGSCLK
jgi:hypothetical protein